jgi:hypothetical protein
MIVSGDKRLATFCLFSAAFAAGAPPAHAQNFTVDSITPVQLDLGQLVSAANGDTVFRISPTDGSVTKLSGQGSRPGGSVQRHRITLTCTGDDSCEEAQATVSINATGSPTGRAGALSGFTVAAGPTPPIMGSPTGSGTVTFTVSGIPRDETRDFYLGADFTLAASGSTGVASADFLVSVGSSSRSGSIIATAWRPITLTNLSALSFGRIIPPASGSATVLLDAVSGTRSIVGGSAIALPSPAPSLARFRVTGEGGQSFAVEVPTTFAISGPGGNITVATNSDSGATAVLDSAAGSAGAHEFNVGGSFELPSSTAAGSYSGSFQVSVHYN